MSDSITVQLSADDVANIVNALKRIVGTATAAIEESERELIIARHYGRTDDIETHTLHMSLWNETHATHSALIEKLSRGTGN